MSLLDTVTSFLPRFTRTAVTLRDLLTHSSGLPADVPDAKDISSREQLVDYLFTVGLQYPTNTDVVYSDIGFMLLGFVIEAATGLPLDEAARRLVFEPLGMASTHYCDVPPPVFTKEHPRPAWSGAPTGGNETPCEKVCSAPNASREDEAKGPRSLNLSRYAATERRNDAVVRDTILRGRVHDE